MIWEDFDWRRCLALVWSASAVWGVRRRPAHRVLAPSRRIGQGHGGRPGGRVGPRPGNTTATPSRPERTEGLQAMCHLIPISLVPPDPDRSAVSWTEKPHLSPEVAMS